MTSLSCQCYCSAKNRPFPKHLASGCHLIRTGTSKLNSTLQVPSPISTAATWALGKRVAFQLAERCVDFLWHYVHYLEGWQYNVFNGLKFIRGKISGFSQGTLWKYSRTHTHTQNDLPATCSSRILLHTPRQTCCDSETMASLIKPHTDIDLIEQCATAAFHTLHICRFT